MAKPGPRPTPTQVLRLRGSWRSKRNPTEPQPEAAKPEAPPWLSDGAKHRYEVVVVAAGGESAAALVDGAGRAECDVRLGTSEAISGWISGLNSRRAFVCASLGEYQWIAYPDARTGAFQFPALPQGVYSVCVWIRGGDSETSTRDRDPLEFRRVLLLDAVPTGSTRVALEAPAR